MGETELVLDTLAVDDALRLLGATRGTRQASTSNSERRAAEPIVPVAGGSDWRQALRAAGAAPESAGKPPSTPFDNVPRKQAIPPAPVVAPSVVPVGSDEDSLDKIAAAVRVCTRCPLYATATNPVPGEGNPRAELMCVGEAPGQTEDETGRPFVGAAGQLLTKILEAIQLPRDQVYICNVLKHRPPGNRNPLPEEVTACSPYLIRQIELIRPKVILALGSFAAQALLQSKLSLSKLRGQIHEYHGVPVVVTYHPAALLRNPSWKRPTWEDVQLARRILDRVTEPGP